MAAISPSRRARMPCIDTGRVSLFFRGCRQRHPSVLLLHGLGGCSESRRVVINGHKGEDMPFIASNGLTEAGTSKTIAVGGMPGGMNVHYHDLGAGEPVLFLHSYGPGTTAWITFHKTIGGLSQHFRCILMALPNFSKTGPIVYREGVHAVQARTAVALLDALGIERAHWVGSSQGGQSAMVAAITYPERVGKFVMGGSHIGTGGDRYLMANRPSEGSIAILNHIADSRLVLLNNCGHWPPFEKPAEWAAQVLAFLRGY